ncbi:hypothetical protein LK542_04730 [Massilia sp. IC2-477]|uniref:hypothetical protein n=1 Tax=Massilia sp. IC2-477 TaxID=2887198 RepID=UPI001D103110|nr:hypothetical protein [Massilia sp. IC2-477]MCC2954920.1 hypothetical protein [Massilia sp. IC2-477]
MTKNKFKLAGSSHMTPIENMNRKEIRIKSDAARIKEIVFLNGQDGEKANSVQQYVNLERSKTFVDGSTISNLDRLGNRPRLKVSFSKPGTHQFIVKCRPHADNADYSDGELARNPRFKYQKEQKSYTTESDGSLILPLDDFFTSLAGKDKYVFDATDTGGQTVSTGNLEVHRLIYLVEIKMRSLKSCANSLSIVEKEFAKHNIRLVNLPTVETDYLSNIGHEEKQTFLKNLEKAYSTSKAKSVEPYSIAVTYTGHLAIKKSKHRILQPSVKVGPGCPKELVEIVGDTPSSDSPIYFYLWQNLDSEDWFVSARFIKDSGTRADIVNIPRNKCTAVSEKPNSPKAAKVSIDVSALPAATGTIELIVHTVDYMRAGMAFSGVNVICVGTQAWWETIDEHEQNLTIIHELGHKIGMVPDGTGKWPDKPPTWYDNAKGHVGNHCFNGLPPNLTRYDGDVDGRRTKCVMFGASNGKTEFCTNCAPIVRKVDMSDGWEPL